MRTHKKKNETKKKTFIGERLSRGCDSWLCVCVFFVLFFGLQFPATASGIRGDGGCPTTAIVLGTVGCSRVVFAVPTTHGWIFIFFCGSCEFEDLLLCCVCSVLFRFVSVMFLCLFHVIGYCQLFRLLLEKLLLFFRPGEESVEVVILARAALCNMKHVVGCVRSLIPTRRRREESSHTAFVSRKMIAPAKQTNQPKKKKGYHKSGNIGTLRIKS